jgi:hypothetical protein
VDLTFTPSEDRKRKSISEIIAVPSLPVATTRTAGREHTNEVMTALGMRCPE